MNRQIMRSEVAAVGMVMLVGMATFAGTSSNPWNSKGYQQWDDKDITMILKSSPWVRSVTVEQTWKPLSPADANNGSSGGTLGASSHGASVMPSEHDDDATTRGADEQFLVYWSSARTVRGALAQRAILHAGSDAKQAEEYVSAPQAEDRAHPRHLYPRRGQYGKRSDLFLCEDAGRRFASIHPAVEDGGLFVQSGCVVNSCQF